MLFALLVPTCPSTTTKTIEVYNNDKFIGIMRYLDDDFIYVFEKFNVGTYNGIVWTDDFKYTFIIKKEPNVSYPKQ